MTEYPVFSPKYCNIISKYGIIWRNWNMGGILLWH